MPPYPIARLLQEGGRANSPVELSWATGPDLKKGCFITFKKGPTLQGLNEEKKNFHKTITSDLDG